MLGGWGIVLAIAFSATDRNAVSAGSAGQGGAPLVPSPARTADDEGASRLAWIVSGADRSIPETVYDCLERGPDCPSDAVLDLDTVRLRSEALAAALSAAIDPISPSYVGEAGRESTDLASQTAVAARLVVEGLGSWMASGCAGNLDEIVTIDGRPAPPLAPGACGAAAAEIQGQLEALQNMLGRWQAG